MRLLFMVRRLCVAFARAGRALDAPPKARHAAGDPPLSQRRARVNRAIAARRWDKPAKILTGAARPRALHRTLVCLHHRAASLHEHQVCRWTKDGGGLHMYEQHKVHITFKSSLLSNCFDWSRQ